MELNRIILELDEDDDEVKQLAEEEVVRLSEVDGVGAGAGAEVDGADTVARRTVCCVDDSGCERDHTAEAACPRNTRGRGCKREDDVEVEDGVEVEVRLGGLVLIMAEGGKEEDLVGRGRVGKEVVAVGEVDGEGTDDADVVWRAGIFARRAVCCAGDGGGERGHSADSDGIELESECGIVDAAGGVQDGRGNAGEWREAGVVVVDVLVGAGGIVAR